MRAIRISLYRISCFIIHARQRGRQTSRAGTIAYYNKRAEMGGTMRDWLKGGAIDDDPELKSPV